MLIVGEIVVICGSLTKILKLMKRRELERRAPGRFPLTFARKVSQPDQKERAKKRIKTDHLRCQIFRKQCK